MFVSPLRMGLPVVLLAIPASDEPAFKLLNYDAKLNYIKSYFFWSNKL